MKYISTEEWLNIITNDEWYSARVCKVFQNCIFENTLLDDFRYYRSKRLGYFLFENCVFENIDFKESAACMAKFFNCTWLNCNMSQSMFCDSIFHEAKFYNCNWSKSDLRNSKFENCYIENSVWTLANMNKVVANNTEEKFNLSYGQSFENIIDSYADRVV